ncbi:MAG TPA: hypothetical protein DDY57_13105, partial [Franconibacter pulveris]|nr:hypothetical protein [Franconibacter pulveris]
DQHSYDPLARIDGTQSPDTQPGKNLKPYDIRTRSCLTHVMEVLAAGDVDVPDSAMRQYGFIQKKLGLGKCKKRGD